MAESLSNREFAAPRISVIVACLNEGRVLARCLDSIAHQDYPNMEVVVADGSSSDASAAILRRHSAILGAALVWFSEPDSGIADAWNRAVARATGDWFLFIGADDVLASSTVISEVARLLHLADRCHRVAYARVLVVARSGQDWEVLGRNWSLRDFRNCRFNLPHQGVFHHRSLFEAGARFDTSYTIVADFDFLLRELKHAEPLDMGDLIVCRMRAGGISNRPLQAPRGVAEQIRLYRHHVGGSSPMLYWGLLKAWIKVVLYVLGGDSLVLIVRSVYRSSICLRA
jgi:glycosyltransferase involved in cell wall biosynthesis